MTNNKDNDEQQDSPVDWIVIQTAGIARTYVRGSNIVSRNINVHQLVHISKNKHIHVQEHDFLCAMREPTMRARERVMNLYLILYEFECPDNKDPTQLAPTATHKL
jgi:hypothetical protein